MDVVLYSVVDKIKSGKIYQVKNGKRRGKKWKNKIGRNWKWKELERFGGMLVKYGKNAKGCYW